LRRIVAGLLPALALTVGNVGSGDANAVDESGSSVSASTGDAERLESAGRRVFLDVGAHVGETLSAALDPRYPFQWIVCFEPVGACWGRLRRLADDRVEVCTFGLWKETTRLPIHGAGSLGASLFSGASVGDGPDEMVELRRASDWFRDNVRTGDEVYLKLNCEGSECDILEDLIESREIRKVRSVLVDFDVRKFPSLAHREADVRGRLEAAGYSRILCLKESFKGPTHAATVENWLRSAGAVSSPPPAWWTWRFVRYPALVRASVSLGKGAGRRLLPQALYERARLRIQRGVFHYPPDAGDTS